MSKISRRKALARGGQIVAAAAAFPILPHLTAKALESDAALLELEAQVTLLIDEINAGLHSPNGNVTAAATTRELDLEAAIVRQPASGPIGIAVKLRRQRFHIEEYYCQDAKFIKSALADLDRLMGRAS